MYPKNQVIDGKGTDNFNPDFIVWTDNTVYALIQGRSLNQTTA